MSASLRLLGLCTALTVLPAAARDSREGDSDRFGFELLEEHARPESRFLTDVNGDGLVDLGFLRPTPNDEDRFQLRVCLQNQEGSFADSCRTSELPAGLAAFDVGKVEQDGDVEFVALGRAGALRARFENGALGLMRSIAQVTSLFSGSERDRPLRLRMLWDLDGDGTRELLVPTVEGPAIHRFQGASAPRVQLLESPAAIRTRDRNHGHTTVHGAVVSRRYVPQITIQTRSPDVFVEDFDGDGHTDVITQAENRLQLFRGRADGTLPSRPSLELERSILSPEEKEDRLTGEALTFADLNGDGQSDLIMMKWGSREERTRLDRHVFFARAGLVYPYEADQVVRSESVFGDFDILDLDRDGRLDLVIPFFHVAPAQAVKVMTQNAVKLQLRLFLMRPTGRYGQDEGKTFAKVDRRIVRDYRFDIVGMLLDGKPLPDEDFKPLIHIGGDFNGDGFPDLVADTGADRLEFYWGNENADYGGSADHVIDFETATDFELKDLNGDGRTDIVGFYAARAPRKTEADVEHRERQRRMGPGGRARPDPATPALRRGAAVKILLSR